MGSIVRALYRDYNILTHFTPPRPSMLVVMPPLVVTKEQINQFVDALDDLIGKGLFKLFSKFLIGNVKEIL